MDTRFYDWLCVLLTVVTSLYSMESREHQIAPKPRKPASLPYAYTIGRNLPALIARLRLALRASAPFVIVVYSHMPLELIRPGEPLVAPRK